MKYTNIFNNLKRRIANIRMYSVDTAIQKHPGNRWAVNLYADGLWRVSWHSNIDDARNAVRLLLTQYGGKIGK